MLTDADRRVLIHMIRKEARTLGYGKRYGWNEDNREYWPNRLKVLRRIVRKLLEEV